MKRLLCCLFVLGPLTACVDDAPPPPSSSPEAIAPPSLTEAAPSAAEDPADPESAPSPKKPEEEPVAETNARPEPAAEPETIAARVKKPEAPKLPSFRIEKETSERFYTKLTNVTDKTIMLTQLVFHSIQEGRLPVKLIRDFPGDADELGRFVCGGEVFEKIETEAEKELVNPFSRDMRIAFEGEDFIITGMTLLPGQSISFGPYDKERFNRLDLSFVSFPIDTAFLRLAEDGERLAIPQARPVEPGARSKKVFRLRFAFEAADEVNTYESLRAVRWYQVANEDCGKLDAAVPPPYRYGVRGEAFEGLRDAEVSAALAQ